MLAFFRDRLTERNTYIPPVLPAVMAQLGYARRAEELARSLVYSASQVQALGELAVVTHGYRSFLGTAAALRGGTDRPQQRKLVTG